MRYTIDRLEEDLAVCEDEQKKLVSISKEKLPQGIKEGDVLKEESGIFFPDETATAERRKKMRKRLMDLFE